jgi:hypothetical protein
MPRAKRPLAEIDPNVPTSSNKRAKETPETKREYSDMTKAELITCARDENIPYSGSKETLITRLTEAGQETGQEKFPERIQAG